MTAILIEETVWTERYLSEDDAEALWLVTLNDESGHTVDDPSEPDGEFDCG